MPAGLAETATSVGTQIGRYFSLTSLMPSLLFVTWMLALTKAVGSDGSFDLGEAGHALSHWTAGKAGLVLAGALLLSFVVHPLLFATTQLLEGYWGPRPFAVRLATVFALRHRDRQDRLEDRATALGRTTKRVLNELVRRELGLDAAAFKDISEAEKKSLRATMRAKPDGAVVYGLILARNAILKSLDTMPDSDRMLPTRLGNALRRIEDSVGRQYGLDLITIGPHLAVAAAPSRAAYLNDSREQMDVSIRLAFYGLLSAVLTTIWLLGAGWWLLLALVPYAFAYVTYRGAVAAAGAWGAALATCMDLDRFALYDAMHVDWPTDSRAERRRNAKLIELLKGEPSASVTYVRPKKA